MSIFEQRESNLRAYSRVYPTVFDKAINARQIDENGKEFIDFFAGAGVLNFGHNNERMTKAVIEYIQSNGVTHSLDMSTTAKRTFMETFLEVVLKPRDMPHVMQFVGPTGTNAVEAAMKLARRVTGRNNIVAFNHAFHGMTLGALAATANNYFRAASGVPLNHVTHHPFGCDVSCQAPGQGKASVDLLRAQYEDSSSGLEMPAAFMLEVIQAEGGVNVADKEWLKELQQLATDLGALFIVDEIQVGMGRTGSFFSFDDCDIDPDIICLAKGLGGLGTPLAMNLVKPEYDQHWSPGEHTGTFRGQSLSLVAGTEALKYFLDDVLMKEVERKAKLMVDMLSGLVEHDGVSVRGKGMILGIDIGDGAVAKKVVAACFDNGLLLGACGTEGCVIKLIPPLTIDDADLVEGMNIVINATQTALEAS